VGVRDVLVEPRPQVVSDHVRHIPHGSNPLGTSEIRIANERSLFSFTPL
jgi:hypothetical protein